MRAAAEIDILRAQINEELAKRGHAPVPAYNQDVRQVNKDNGQVKETDFTNRQS